MLNIKIVFIYSQAININNTSQLVNISCFVVLKNTKNNAVLSGFSMEVISCYEVVKADGRTVGLMDRLSIWPYGQAVWRMDCMTDRQTNRQHDRQTELLMDMADRWNGGWTA